MRTLPGKFGSIARKPTSFSTETLVKTSFMTTGASLPLVIEPNGDNVNVAQWSDHNRDFINTQLGRHGAILFRGFRLDTTALFESFARAVSPRLLDYRERSSPRSEVSQGIYTSTDHPADQFIHFHNEQSYTKSWPMKIFFYCARKADQGGATPLADGRKVLQLLSPETRTRFLAKRVMYVRNYVEGLGLSWQAAFQTSDKSTVEEYCRKSSIDFTWVDGRHLRTKQIFDAITTHPGTREALWFEHAAFFHVSSLDPHLRKALLLEYQEENLPFNTYYGDGSTIEDSALDEIRGAYKQVAVSFPWQDQDVLLIDNMLVSHSREPFVGPRRVLVAMAELYPDKHDPIIAPAGAPADSLGSV